MLWSFLFPTEQWKYFFSLCFFTLASNTVVNSPQAGCRHLTNWTVLFFLLLCCGLGFLLFCFGWVLFGLFLLVLLTAFISTLFQLISTDFTLTVLSCNSINPTYSGSCYKSSSHEYLLCWYPHTTQAAVFWMIIIWNLLPGGITVPGGSNVKLEYSTSSQAEILNIIRLCGLEISHYYYQSETWSFSSLTSWLSSWSGSAAQF